MKGRRWKEGRAAGYLEVRSVNPMFHGMEVGKGGEFGVGGAEYSSLEMQRQVRGLDARLTSGCGRGCLCTVGA